MVGRRLSGIAALHDWLEGTMEGWMGWSERQSELDQPALPPLAWLDLGLWDEAVGREEESMLSMLLH